VVPRSASPGTKPTAVTIACTVAVTVATTTVREHLLKHHLVQRVQGLLQRLHTDWPCLRRVR
jgi:hypothetical protein